MVGRFGIPREKNILNAHLYGNLLRASQPLQYQQQFQPTNVADSRGNTLTLVTGNTIPVRRLRFWIA